MAISMRAATLHGYVEVAESLGLDPGTQLAEAGLDPGVLAYPDRWVSAAAIARLLHNSATSAATPDFALRLSARRRLSTLGPLSLVLREEPTLRTALGLLLRYERSYNEALRMRLGEANGVATITVSLEFDELVPSGQAMELAVAALHGIVREFVGPSWTALAVYFAHPGPRELSAHREVFGPRVGFGREVNGIVLSAGDLDAPSTLADPLLRPYSDQLLASLTAPRQPGAAAAVQEAMELLLPLGRCTMTQVARSLGVDQRTLHRRLAAEGETFSGLLHRVRGQLAGRHLSEGRYSMTEISDLLGFSAPSGFTRWFRQQFHTSPRQWRQARIRGAG
ncbi:MAG: AraC family transcriptional regulator [Actinomycetales bacterium]